MIFFIDCEFDGFGGPLLSMALVPADENQAVFYEVIQRDVIRDRWVQENVVPILNKEPIFEAEFSEKFGQYLDEWEHDEPHRIIADWPDDIRFFCEAMHHAPGIRFGGPLWTLEIRADLGDYVSEIPHNALEDALAIKTLWKKRR